MEACVPAVGGFSLDKRAEVPERAKASVLSRPRTPTVAEFISSDLMLSVLLIAERSGASKGVTERSDGTSVGLVERGGRLVLPLTERSREAERSGRSARLSRVVRLPLNVMIYCEGTP
jgi:hypothetical protein